MKLRLTAREVMKKLFRRVKRRVLSDARATVARHPDELAEPLGGAGTWGETEDEGEAKQTLSAYIHHLPPELLVKIFDYDLGDPQYSAGKWTAPRRTIQRVISLSSVCSYWRRSAIETSSFWSHIPFFGRNSNLEHLTSLCVERAKNSLLDIVVFTPADYKSWDLVQKSMGKNHIQRLRSLSLLARNPIQPHAVLRFLELENPRSLSELSVTLSPILTGQFNEFHIPIKLFSTPQDDRWVPGFITLIKQLHTLDLTDVDIDWEQYEFDQLHTLRLKGHRSLRSVKQLAHVLTTSPQLESLTIADLSGFSESADHMTASSLPICLPNLRNIHLDYLGFHALCVVLRTLPTGPYNIKLFICDIELNTFAVDQQGSSGRIAELSTLLDKFPNVTALGIVVANQLGLADWFPYVIRSLPNLNTLLLSNARIDKNLISGLVTKLSDTPFPRITMLKLHSAKVEAVEEFKNMIMNHLLERIELHSCDLVLELPSKDSRHFESPLSNLVTPIKPGSDFHGWLTETVPQVLVSY